MGMGRRPSRRILRTNRRGAALVEFALLLPVMILLVLGGIGYAQYLLLAHTVQQVASDAARATVQGLDPPERRRLAEESIGGALARLPELSAAKLTTDVGEGTPWVTVRVTYDASDLPLIRTGVFPAPPAMIVRRAVIRQGGFL